MKGAKKCGQAEGRAHNHSLKCLEFSRGQANGVETTLLSLCPALLLFVCDPHSLLKGTGSVTCGGPTINAFQEFISRTACLTCSAQLFTSIKAFFVSFETWEGGNFGQGFSHYFYSFIHSFTYSANIFIDTPIMCQALCNFWELGVNLLCLCVYACIVENIGWYQFHERSKSERETRIR